MKVNLFDTIYNDDKHLRDRFTSFSHRNVVLLPRCNRDEDSSVERDCVLRWSEAEYARKVDMQRHTVKTVAGMLLGGAKGP